ncbi:MAG: hypothetical protein M0038_10000 [Pseudomonadota bacterium]|jgi:hypothetical protein|nr:hypothetical protein [Pseudomonadota bacterium]
MGKHGFYLLPQAGSWVLVLTLNGDVVVIHTGLGYVEAVDSGLSWENLDAKVA